MESTVDDESPTHCAESQSQTQAATHYMLLFIWHPKRAKVVEMRSEKYCYGPGVRRDVNIKGH